MLLDDVMLMSGGEGEAGGAALVLTVLVGAGRTNQHNKTADQQQDQPRVLQDSEGSVTVRKQQNGEAADESLPEERELEELLEEAREVRCMLEVRVMNGMMEG